MAQKKREKVKTDDKPLPESPLDRTDRAILALLQTDARLSATQLAERVSLSTSPCWRRIKRLERAGFVRGYRAVLDERRLGFGVTAFVSVMLERHTPAAGRAFEEAVRAIPQILACHNVSGRYDFLLHVVAADLEAFGRFARETIRALPGVKEMYSSFSLKEVKGETGMLLPV